MMVVLKVMVNSLGQDGGLLGSPSPPPSPPLGFMEEESVSRSSMICKLYDDEDEDEDEVAEDRTENARRVHESAMEKGDRNMFDNAFSSLC